NPGGRRTARLKSLCRNSECRKKVEQGTAPAAKRRHGKARHGSAGKQKWNKVESRRDDTPVATQTLKSCPSTKPLASQPRIGSSCGVACGPPCACWPHCRRPDKP